MSILRLRQQQAGWPGTGYRSLLLIGLAALVTAQLGGGLYGSIRGLVRSGNKRATTRHMLTHPVRIQINGDFERDTAGWTGWNATLARDTSAAVSGAASMDVVDGGNGGGMFTAYYLVPMRGRTTGRTFRVSMWVGVPAGSGLIGTPIGLQLGEVGGRSPGHLVVRSFVKLRAGWRQLRALYTVRASDRTSFRFGPLVLQGAVEDHSDLRVDDVRLTRVPRPRP